jgi:hypothetical protein
MNSENNLKLNKPWENVYWFFIMLMNSDKYGDIGKKTKAMLGVSYAIKSIIKMDEEGEEDKLELLDNAVRNAFLYNIQKDTHKYSRIENLCDDLSKRLLKIKDYKILSFVCEHIMVPINNLLDKIPNDDKIFAESIAKAFLDKKGSDGLATVINLWDDLGSQGCMAAERIQIVNGFKTLRENISDFLTKEEMDIVLTSFCQEFERRVGQKRKGRAGRGLETVTSFILDYFNIKATHAPEHFTTGLEIDKWIKTKDGWFIGISCKRTLRERWKQAYTTDVDLLNRHKIRELWHLITYDKDLSDDKITEIGSHRAVLYLPDQSPRLKHALKHPGMRDYVRPLTSFIDDLLEIISKS